MSSTEGSSLASTSLSQYFPETIRTRYYPLAHFQRGAHEDQGAGFVNNPAPGLDKLANLDRIREVHVKLRGCLGLLVVGVPGRQTHGSVGKGHQHPSLNDSAPIVMLRLRQKAVPDVPAIGALPPWSNEPNEAVVSVRFPAVSSRIKGQGIAPKKGLIEPAPAL